MIHFRVEGEILRVGLNLCFTRSRLTVHWVWFRFAQHEASCRGFTISKHGFRWRSARWNVIDDYLRSRGLSVVHDEVLQDLRALETEAKRRIEGCALIKPRSAA